MGGKVADPCETSEFGKELLRFVRAMGLDAKVVSSMSRFDFSRTSHIRLVHSMLVFTTDSAEIENHF
jgi:hypothetical protein